MAETIEARFKKAVWLIRNGPAEKSSNETKLLFYSYFKQVKRKREEGASERRRKAKRKKEKNRSMAAEREKRRSESFGSLSPRVPVPHFILSPVER